MADNIKIIGNIDDIQRINRLNLDDLNLLNSQIKNQTFGFENDYIEYFIYDGGNNLINSNYNYRNFKLPSDSYITSDTKLPLIEIDPTLDLQSLGYISGQFKTQYNFQTRKISSPNAELFISEISEDRTEIGIKSIDIASEDLIKYGNSLISELENSNEQKYFILNLTNNNQLLVINVAVKVDDFSILLKLYEPLPQDIFEKENCWITEEIIEPYVFDINLNTSIIPSELPKLKGPNFSIELDIKQNISTEYQNYSNLVSSLTGSSYHKVLNYMNDNSYDLNIDYTSFDNFIHFSSAKKRLEIFYNKVKQIEDYNTDINIITGSSHTLKNEQTSSIKLQIDNIIQNFDGFENYLYFESSSYSWPKVSSIRPYSLLSTGSTISKTWYDLYTGSAESYDENNLDHLYNIIPNYIKNDPDSYQSYYNFVDMIGHYFDNIWIYISSISELYNADNNLEKGVSKDIVYDALSSLGVKLYNNKGDDDFDNYINGLNSGSTLFIDDFSATSSYLNNISKKDLLAETYKRIYHNIPLLSKTKGTSTGLQNLITTFGISSSILSPKEFGGSTTKNEIKGYDNDKINISNNTITGSVLSSLISLQTTSTASSEFTSPDLHFVDLSFSPQNELNSRLSSSIALLSPTFSLDDYIGDPSLMASSSYSSLIEQNNYFTSASSAISGSEKRLDYKGFIELVKYFDNSLFKMLKDFVPARTNVLTGITIKSPILERNKLPVYQPKVTNQSLPQAEYPAPEMVENVDSIYSFIEGDKKPYYTGEFSGSYVNVYDYFENTNPNPYLTPSSSFDINKFNHSDFNVLLNNVSSSVISTSRKKLEKLYVTNNSIVNLTGSNNFEITSDVELQDSNLSLMGYQNSRYDGTKISSLKYNDYTSASLVYSGDNSYGKTSVINHNTRKLGLFTNISTNIFLKSTSKNNVALKYLVDENGNLTELNEKNKNWVEVQNTFKAGNVLTISQFNNIDKKLGDGIKSIYNSGYSYYPMLYITSSTERIYFEYSGEDTNKLFGATFNYSNPYINGINGGANGYSLYSSGSFGWKVVYNTFDIESYDDSSKYTPGTAGLTYSNFEIPAQGNYTFNPKFNISVTTPVLGATINFRYKIISGSLVGPHPDETGIHIIGDSGIKTFTSNYSVTFLSTGYEIKQRPDYSFISFTSAFLPDSEYSTIVLFNDVGGVSRTFTRVSPTEEQYNDGSSNYYLKVANYSCCSGLTFSSLCFAVDGASYISDNDVILNISNISGISNNTTGIIDFDFSSNSTNFNTDDKVYFKLEQSGSTTNFTASFLAGGLLKNNLTSNASGDYVYAVGTSVNHLISSSITYETNYDSITLNSSLTNLENYLFIPNPSNVGSYYSTDQQAIYNTYGNINDVFKCEVGDVIYVEWLNQSIELEIKSVGYDNLNKRRITFTSPLPGSLANLLNSASNTDKTGLTKFLLLKKTPDESNIMLNFAPASSSLSTGLIIPNNIHPDVLANIDIITKEVKQKLIDIGYNITTV